VFAAEAAAGGALYVVVMTATPEQIETVTKIIESARVAMVTTVGEDGRLVSRPLALLERVFDGDLWFFTEDPSPKTAQVRANEQLNVAVQADNDYVSLSGTATVSRDRTMIEGLWNRHAEAWFDHGIDDPAVALLHFRAASAEYWTVDSPKVVAAIKYAAAIVTGGQPDVGTNEVVDLENAPVEKHR
jgi:general stress protein 26